MDNVNLILVSSGVSSIDKSPRLFRYKTARGMNDLSGFYLSICADTHAMFKAELLGKNRGYSTPHLTKRLRGHHKRQQCHPAVEPVTHL